jgi:host factor-I protein
MENKPAQNIQDTFLNTVRKDKTPITIYLVSGVKLTGKIRSFDKYSVLLENNSQEQLIFKHAISTVVSNRSVMHTEHRPAAFATGVPGVRSACRGVPLSAERDKQAGAASIGSEQSVRRTSRSRVDKPERAVLVGVDLGVRSRAQRRRQASRVRGRPSGCAWKSDAADACAFKPFTQASLSRANNALTGPGR